MVFGLAPAVNGLALSVAQDIHLARVGHGLQNSVRGGQGHGLALILQTAMQILGGNEILEAPQCPRNGPALLGIAHLGLPGGLCAHARPFHVLASSTMLTVRIYGLFPG
ncbi:hypothetical protein GCM10009824_01830 [Kocuria atrinae]|uniref:Uncharacterized protein n=1 Tax=Kocuria atrinae TaxID=592377 RepID=A0ABN2XD24_9MICC